MWSQPKNIEVPETFLQEVGVSEMIGSLLFRRGYSTVKKAREFLFPEEYHPTSAAEIPDLEKGVSLVSQAIREDKKIGVWGDFDVDGQTSTTLLVSAFEELGGNVIFHIPVRETESHGINIPNLQKMIGAGIDLLVTCDTGISAHKAVDYAREQGVSVVITDHHDLPETLPSADAVINPSMLDEEHPLFTLPGVGVAYKFVEHLFAVWGNGHDPKKYLDLVALGIVADVAALVGDARFLLQQGLRVLRTTERLGLKVLIEKAEISQKLINAEDIGFSLAPRLNALGRLGDANVIVEFLTTLDEGRVRLIAEQLEGYNRERKLLTRQVYDAALAQLKEDDDYKNNAVIVLKGPEWPAGVVGIVAGRIAEKFGKPAVMLSVGKDGICRGSARSVEGIDITAAISQCSDLLDGFGGHPMAAGMSMKLEQFPAFKRRLNRAVQAQIGGQLIEVENQFDVRIGLDGLTPLLLDEINLLAPFGHGNPPVLFAVENVRLVSRVDIGRTEEHQRLILEDEQDNQVTVMWWRGAGEPLPSRQFNLVFTIKANHFKGDEELQLEYVDSWATSEVEGEPEVAIELEVQDLRTAELKKVASSFVDKSDLLFWGEGVRLSGYSLLPREQLHPAQELMVVTVPPTQKILKDVLGFVQPQKVMVLGLDPKVDQLTPFLKRLTGVCKYIVNAKEGVEKVSSLAGAMAHSLEAVKAGLQWLSAKGIFVIEFGDAGEVYLSSNEDGVGVGSLTNSEETLKFYLEEAKAYRKFFKGLSPSELEDYIRELTRETYG
ncbi:single-stranded-DNA-specific exonuclease RecJ [bacterium]|nr:single-stranded-DNA-specific exonuclease RecJ [bacterium]